MRARRPSFTRTLTALVLALSFGISSAESLRADVHDGDATHEELLQVDGEVRHGALHRSHGDNGTFENSENQLVHAADDAGDHPGESIPGESGHDVHTCHLAHLHGISFPSCLDNELMNAPHCTLPSASNEQLPVGRVTEPQYRPPII